MSVVLNGITAPIGGFTVEAGGCMTGNVTIAGATQAMMTVEVDPLIYPGDGITFQGYVSAPNTVTVKVCSMTAGYIPASQYNVNVLTGDPGAPSSTSVTQTNFALDNQTGSVPLTTAFTAPATGVYLFFGLVHLNTTNNVGTLTASFTPPHQATAGPVSVPIATGLDVAIGAGRLVYMAAGEQFTFSTTAAGLTGTSYNVYFTVQSNQAGLP